MFLLEKDKIKMASPAGLQRRRATPGEEHVDLIPITLFCFM